MGIRMKILSGFLVLTVMLLVAGAWSIHELSKIGTSVQALLDDNYKSIVAAKMMTEALEREDSAVLLLVSGNWSEGRDIIQEADTSFRESFDVAKRNVTIPGEQAYIDEIESKYTEYKNLWMKPIVGTQRERDIDWYFEEVHSAFLETKATVNKLMTLNDQTMYETASSLKDRAHRAVMPGIVAILSALLFALVFNYFINYYIVSPIVKLTKGVHRFLETKQPFELHVETNDELKQLVSSVQRLLAHIIRAGEKAE